MLTIGEFSNICKISIKTLRYYSEIGLVIPEKINSQTGYRYYSINQLEQVLYINRLKFYNFSLDEIKLIINSDQDYPDFLIKELLEKKEAFEKNIQEAKNRVIQLQYDIDNLKSGKSIMSYMDNIDIKLVDFNKLNILFIRKNIHKNEMSLEYQKCFNKLLNKITTEKLSVLSKPMVLFHSKEFNEDGFLDIEFAIQVKEIITGTRDFEPNLCLKSTHKGSYSGLSSIYSKQLSYAERKGFIVTGPLFEIYITDPSQVDEENLYITEIYLPVKKGKPAQ